MDDELRRLERELNTTPADFDLRRKVAQAHRTRGNYLRGNEIMLAPEHIELPPFREWPDQELAENLDFYIDLPSGLMLHGGRHSRVYFARLEICIGTFKKRHHMKRYEELLDAILTLDAMELFLSYYLKTPGHTENSTCLAYNWNISPNQDFRKVRETCMRVGDYLQDEMRYALPHRDD